MTVEETQKLVREEILYNTETRLRDKGLYSGYHDELPEGRFLNNNTFDLLEIGADKRLQFETPEQSVLATTIASRNVRDIEIGLAEIATGFGTGAVLSESTTPIDLTANNSKRYPAAQGYLYFLTGQIFHNDEAIKFITKKDEIPERNEGLIHTILESLNKRIVYEYLRDVREEPSEEPDNLSLNKVLEIIKPEYAFDIDPKEMPEVNPVQRSIYNYALNTAHDFVKKHLELEGKITDGKALKKLNVETGKVSDENIEVSKEGRKRILENLLLKLTGMIDLNNTQELYREIGIKGPRIDDGDEHLDYSTLSEEVTETHEAIHKLARTVRWIPYYTPNFNSVVKIGFLQARYQQVEKSKKPAQHTDKPTLEDLATGTE